MVTDRIIQGDAREVLRGLDAESVHCVVTSPPYWSLRDYGLPPLVWDDGWEGTLGLEPTVEMWLEHQVEIFREVKRVMRADATLWVNLGANYQDQQLIPQPWLLALALQRDGWWLRSSIIWVKGREPEWATIEDGQSVGAGMPETVGGWRWERCRVKVEAQQILAGGRYETEILQGGAKRAGINPDWLAQWAPCPGCPKCEANDGYVLRKGAWRPTTAHEYIFLLTKEPRYFCDQEAVREPQTGGAHSKGKKLHPPIEDAGIGHKDWHRYTPAHILPAGRNKRSVWFFISKGLALPHFAAFPEMLPEICIRAGTSEKGVCPECGAPWARVVEVSGGTIGASWHDHRADLMRGQRVTDDRMGDGSYQRQTLGWRPTCDCPGRDGDHPWRKLDMHWSGEDNWPTIPATVLDPFVGSGTTAIAARKLGRDCIGVDLSPEYCEMARERLAKIPGHQMGLEM